MARSPVPPHAAGMPRLIDQLMQLPATVRLVAGAFMLVLGVVPIGCGFSFYSILLLGLAVACGVPLVASGIADRRRLRHEASEMARARADLPALRGVVAAAGAAGHPVGSALRRRGFTSDTVCRWIALECGVVLPRGPQRLP